MTQSAWMLAAAGMTGLVLALPGTAGATVFYSKNFQNGSTYAEWSTNQHYTNAPTFTRFLGRYTNDTVTLTLPTPAEYNRPHDEVPGDPPPGEPPPTRDQLLLEFHLYIIDSWDGSEPTQGPDYFNVQVNGMSIFDETFANQHMYQSYHHLPDVGRAQLGFDQRWVDSIYYMSMPFDVTTDTFHISFRGHGLQVINDESWGIDNINLSIITVPSPGAAALLVLGTFCVAGGRRRR